MEREIIAQLINEAKNVANNNIACNHSNFTVGAALLTKDNRIYTGCNIENHGIQSICAERCAFCKALSEGENKFKAIAIVGKNRDDKLFCKTVPCGYCRQFMSEYVDADFKIYCYDNESLELFTYTISDLLPESFKF